MKVEVWCALIYGVSVICFSFYAIRILPPLRRQFSSPFPFPKHFASSNEIRVLIFTAPPPFSDPTGARQRIAIRSWLDLSRTVRVVLFSQDNSSGFAGAFTPRVTLDSSIDFTFTGTPFFHSMIERSRFYTGDVFVFVDPETVLFSDFISSLSFAHKIGAPWLLFAMPKDVSHLSYRFDATGKHWRKEDGDIVWPNELQKILDASKPKKGCDSGILLAWNSKDLPLHNAVVPPFLFRHGVHNCWLINEALASGLRLVIDASWSMSSVYLKFLGQRNMRQVSSASWEDVGNAHLGAVYGSFMTRICNISEVTKLFKIGGKFHLMQFQDEKMLKNGPLTNHESLNGVSRFFLENNSNSSTKLLLPFELETLAFMIADNDKTVILAIAGYSYKDMMMSWLCRLRQLGIFNFLICAIDQETYDFSVLQGLPVFYDSSAPKIVSHYDCHFGTKCFQRVTKVKSRMVLKILKLGYNVLLSDVDVYWFSNPLPFLKSFGPAVLVGQSDEYSRTGPINKPWRLNSGFYFCRSDAPTIAAIENAVKHAALSNLSEQPCFYDTLCGVSGSKRVGDDRCFDPKTNLTVQFLDRNLFPNGAYRRIWEKKSVKASCKKMGCVVLHNNWIKAALKVERQKSAGLWEYDECKRMCLHRRSARIPDYQLEER